MNSLRIVLVLSSAAALALAISGCDPDAKCVADCETADLDGSGSGSSGEPSSSEESGSPGACGLAEADAQAFVDANRECETHADCKLVEGICFQNGPTQCGSVAVSVTADDAQWDALHGALESSCECGANPCGATAVCTDEGICDAQFGTPAAECVFAEQEVELFLAENRACENDDDCVYVDKGCYDGPLAACAAISLNTSADLEIWDQLQEPLGECGHDCLGNECGPTTRCGDDGLCEAVFP